ncbi:MAG: arginase family protein [Sphaerochaetaceae bacterium]|nr:arginase family protein [Sphaerochaetaceae bacterium]MDD3941255.1 arginase family protein [Sphaerochaetaceae bacterium]
MTKLFTLVVPQWQGAAAGTGPLHGARSMVRILGADHIDATVTVNEQSVPKRREGVWYAQEIGRHIRRSLDALECAQAKQVLTIGGDCASDVASISYLNKLYDGNLTVLWLDAHADLNTPQSSPSGKFHGMPLRLLLGEGAPSLLRLLPSVLKSEQVIYTGLRELDHAERLYIVEHSIPNVPMCHECVDMLNTVVKLTRRSNVYLHLDLDVIDPADFDAVSCPSPNGFRFEDLLSSVAELGNAFPIVGCAVTEYQVKGEAHEHKLARLLKTIRTAMTARERV